MVCTVVSDYTSDDLAWLFMKSQIICLVPIFIGDLCILYLSEDFCLFFGDSNFSIGMWLYVDGYFKLGLFCIFMMFYVTYKEAQQNNLILILIGNLIRFFYIFEIGWTITGSVLFWG